MKALLCFIREDIKVRYNVNRISDKHNFIITGVSYAGKPKCNTMMYITKKVEYLLDNLHDVKECLIFLENGMDVPNDIQCANCGNPAREFLKG